MSDKPARECSRCGKVSQRVKRCPHSIAELGDPGNPLLCRECNLAAPR